MRKTLCLLLCLLLLAAFPAPSAAEGPVEISDAAGLLAIRDDPAGDYALAADIDLAGVEWTPLPFSGTLDGRGHTIYNLSVTAPGAEVRLTRDGNLKAYDTVFAGLFSTLETAQVRDLSLRGVYVNVETGSHCFAAALAGYLDHSLVSGCTVEGRVAMIGSGVMVGVGGLCGYGCGSVEDCRAEVELFYEDRCFDRRCEQFMGGVLACGVADMDRCTVAIQGYDSCHGYVHNGGLCGMYYQCGMDFPFCSICDNYVSGQISFFEDNPDRRAYCAPFRGEFLTGVRAIEGNRDDFERRETFDYSRVLLPESCESPDIVEELTPSGCESWGFTRHVCRLCGHSWTDSYTPPAHTPGPWETAAAPDYGAEGLERQLCAVCGALLGERPVSALIPTESCTLSAHEAVLRSGDTLALSAAVTPDGASDASLIWRSSDESVAAVDENGLVSARAAGTALIRAETADGFCSDSCAVTVRYTFLQWIMSLFG
jgi:hypothetical protein